MFNKVESIWTWECHYRHGERLYFDHLDKKYDFNGWRGDLVVNLQTCPKKHLKNKLLIFLNLKKTTLMAVKGTCWCILFGGQTANMHQKAIWLFSKWSNYLCKQSFQETARNWENLYFLIRCFWSYSIGSFLYAVVVYDVYAAIRKSFST